MKLPWRFSYQAKGFVAFKAEPVSGNFTMQSLDKRVAFARRICLSLGKTSDEASALQLIAGSLGSDAVIHRARYSDHKMEGINPVESVRLKTGQHVGTIVELATGEFFAGIHVHNKFTSAYPAGDSGVVMPERSPSRAWLKLEEAIRFFDISLTKKDVVVELGCAPGGVVLALLERGISVIGVDPAKMADVITPYTLTDGSARVNVSKPWFLHIRKPAALLGKKDLGGDVSWFMSDMNQSPEVVIKECLRCCVMAPGICGVLITLKLTDLSHVVDKEKWVAPLVAHGFKTVQVQSLSVNHRELALFALR